MSDTLKQLGKLKMPKDVLNSHRFKGFRPGNRKNPNMVPDSHSDAKKTFTSFISRLNATDTKVDMAKKAKSGVWRINKKQVLDIATKYNFNIPDDNKPSKHLGSTGIQMVKYKPGVYYLYKPRKTRKINTT